MKPLTETVKWEYEAGLPYEFTINYNDDYQFLNVGDLRMVKCKELIKDILIPFKDIQYYLCCEISMPQYGDNMTQTCARVHHHGIIKFKTNAAILKFLSVVYHKLTKIGRIQFNKFRPDYWPKYMIKQRHIFGDTGCTKSIPLSDIILENPELVPELEEFREICEGVSVADLPPSDFESQNHKLKIVKKYKKSQKLDMN